MSKKIDALTVFDHELGKDEVDQIEQEAAKEVAYIKAKQKDIACALKSYMEKNSMGSVEAAKKLDMSTRTFTKIIKEQGPIHDSTIQKIASVIGKNPRTPFGYYEA